LIALSLLRIRSQRWVVIGKQRADSVVYLLYSATPPKLLFGTLKPVSIEPTTSPSSNLTFSMIPEKIFDSHFFSPRQWKNRMIVIFYQTTPLPIGNNIQIPREGIRQTEKGIGNALVPPFKIDFIVL